MGLGFAGGAHWSYGGFASFREQLAKQQGFVLADMDGFGGTTPWTDQGGDLQPLLNHSDCGGELSPEDCTRVAAALRRVFGQYPADPGPEGHDQRQALLLAAGMEACAAAGKPLIFC